MSKEHLLSDQDRVKAGELKFKIMDLRDQLNEQEWELRTLYRKNSFSRLNIESTMNNL